MLLYSPYEADPLIGVWVHSLQDVDSQGKCESGAASASDQDDLVEVHGIGERTVRPVDGCRERRTRIGCGILVQIAGEAVLCLDGELERFGGDDGERVRLEAADGRDPDEAVLPGDRSPRDLLHDDLGAAIR